MINLFVRKGSVVLVAALLAGQTGCVSIGPNQLRVSQADYARALGEAKKRQILAAIVGLRFADTPAFLTASQIIVGYDLMATGGPTINTRPGLGGPALQAAGALALTYASHPTFTFSPATGDAYASFIRPLPATVILPLANSQIPIDLLLRIAAQSIGSLQNATLLGEPNGNGSPGFFELLAVLRRLQLAGAMSIEYREVDHAPAAFLSLHAEGRDAAIVRDVAAARRLLGLPVQEAYRFVPEAQPGAAGAASLPLATRSILGILGNLGAEIGVSPADTASGATKPTVQLVGGETRPTVIVHSGRAAPADAYVGIAYDHREYWIERNDFDSKYAFSIVQDLMALAESSESSKAPVVTIPTG